MSFRRFGLGIVLGICVTACGKYGAPVPPEALSPAPVNDLAVSADASSISLSWKAPTKDIRAKELRSIDGYEVRRAVLKGEGVPEFAPLTFIDDTHLVEQERLRGEARAAGKPVRRVTADPKLSTFTYTDATVSPGTRYVYRIVPVNQGGARGAVGESIEVAFNGTASEFVRSPATDLESELFDGELRGEEF